VIERPSAAACEPPPDPDRNNAAEVENMDAPNPNLAPGFVHAERVSQIPASLKLLTFPDGFRCFTHTSVEETEFIYNEVIVKGEYLQHGLALDGARCIVDAGANIGIFTLFAKSRNPQAVIHAFEPIPETFEVLKLNVELHGLADVHLHRCALGSRTARRRFTYYPNMAGNSTARPSTKGAQLKILRNQLGKELAEFLFRPENRSAPVRTLSDFLDRERIPAVDFLKIDVEGDELAVLQGMDGKHASAIRELSIESHTPRITRTVCAVLVDMGYEVNCESGISSFPGIANVYAVRRGDSGDRQSTMAGL
jgi:FkbM family methyltransferase